MTYFYIILFLCFMFIFNHFRNKYIKSKIINLYGDLVSGYSDCEIFTLNDILSKVKKFNYTSKEFKAFDKLEKSKNKQEFREAYNTLVFLIIKRGESYS